MTQEYIPSRGVNPIPATPPACLQGGVAPGIVAPASPPVYSGGVQMGGAPRMLPSTTIEVHALPTSAGVSEPSLYQHSSAPYHPGLQDQQLEHLLLILMLEHFQLWLSTQALVVAAHSHLHNHQLSPEWSCPSARTSHHCLS